MNDAVSINRLTHSYPPSRRRQEPRVALRNLTIGIEEGDFFCLLGPNGSGKSTLFRILSTLLQPTEGSVTIFNTPLKDHADEIRTSIGVVFQHPSLDKKLTVRENLLHQGHLYNLRGPYLRSRIGETLDEVGASDRADELVEHLSGGLQRRVEIAKALLHRPRLLILDEPSTGLDPGARRDFGGLLQQLQSDNGVTILLTTHILEEAEKCDRIAILDQGSLVALGTPAELVGEVGGDVITVTTADPAGLGEDLRCKMGLQSRIVGETIHIECTSGHEFIPRLFDAFPGRIDAIRLSKPSLEDVFIHKTGHRFWQDRAEE